MMRTTASGIWNSAALLCSQSFREQAQLVRRDAAELVGRGVERGGVECVEVAVAEARRRAGAAVVEEGDLELGGRVGTHQLLQQVREEPLPSLALVGGSEFIDTLHVESINHKLHRERFKKKRQRARETVSKRLSSVD